MRRKFVFAGIIFLLLWAAVFLFQEMRRILPADGIPYPRSQVFSGIEWQFRSFRQAASGSDLWPLSWSADNALYTAWGDGGGFSGTDRIGRVSLGIARITGLGDRWRADNMCGGVNPAAQPDFSGKCNAGLLAIGETLYMYVTEQDRWRRNKIGVSTDCGKHWCWGALGQEFAAAPWLFDEPDGAFASPAIIQFGPGYSHARDEFVYGYGQEGMDTGLALFRVPVSGMSVRQRYEFFAGIDSAGHPVWSTDIARRRPVFTDRNGIGWGYSVCYYPRFQRYLLTVPRGPENGKSRWGVFDAPQPWGPWTTVAYYDRFIDDIRKFTFVFNPKWLQPDGTFWMVFSGVKNYDAFNVLSGRFIIRSAADSLSKTARR